MSDIKSLVFRGSLLRGMILGAHIVVAFFLMPFVVHSLGDRWYGMWALVGTIIGYFSYMDFGISVAAQRYLAGAIGRRDRREIDQLLATGLITFSAMGVIAAVAAVVIAACAPIFLRDPHEIETFRFVVVVLGINAFVTFVAATVNGLLTGNLRYDLVTYIEFVKVFVRTGLIVYFLDAGYSIKALAVITLACDVAGNLAKFALASRLAPGPWPGPKHFTLERFHALFRYGSQTFINQLADMMRFQANHLVIGYFLNLSAITPFNIAGQLVLYFREFNGAIMGVLAPLYARYQAVENTAAVHKTHYFACKVAMVIAVLIGGAAIIFGRKFIELWMGEEYLEAYPLLAIMMIPTMVLVAQSPSLNAIYGLGRVAALARVSIVEAVANVVLSVVFVQYFGLVGVAIGTSISLTGFGLFLLFLGNRVVGGSLGTYLRHVGPTALVLLLIQAGVWLLTQRVVITGYADMLLVCALVYPLGLLFVGMLTFSPYEREVVRQAGLKAIGIG